MAAASSGVCVLDALSLGWPLARFGPHALDSVQKICEEKIFKIFSKKWDSGLRGGVKARYSYSSVQGKP